LEDITPIFLINYFKSFRYLQPSTIKRIKSVLSAIMQSALELNIISYNPCRNMVLKNDKNQHINKNINVKYFSKKTYLQVLNLLKFEPIKYRTIIEFSLKTGLRKSEVFGLTWYDLDTKENIITINKSRNYLNKYGMIIKETKNNSSNRRIYISKKIVALLLSYKREKELDKMHKIKADEFIFDDINFNTITLWFKNWQKKNSINPIITFHDLRHTHATLLLAQGIDAKTISSRLGHSSITTTLNIYAHVLKDLDKKAVQKIEELEYKKTETN